MAVEGKFFDSRSAHAHAALLSAQPDGRWMLRIGEDELSFDPAEVAISDRIGNVPRRIRFRNGAEFETADNDGVDALLHARGQVRGGLVHTLERRWGIALAALAGVALVSFAALKYGVPAVAGWAAARLPASVDQRLGAQTLQILDRVILEPTTLSPQQQSRVDSLFLRMTAGLHDGHNYQLELRSGRLGANAVALPSGIMIVTDDLVNLAQNDEELMAVMAHEIGHVRGRHALRQLIQAAGVSAIAFAVLGDLSTMSSLVAAAPALLHAKNSRALEVEADGFARRWLTDNGIAPSRFDDILCRMGRQHGDDRGEIPSFLSTHPAVSDRARCHS